MLDDEPRTDPFDLDDLDTKSQESRHLLRNCVFLLITGMLIFSLASTSILTYLAIARQERGIAERSEFPTQREEQPIVPQATVEATSVIDVPTPDQPVEREAAAASLEINRIALVNSAGQIETVSPDGTNRRVLTLESDNALFSFPTWAPDGRRLAVLGTRQSGGGIYVLEDSPRKDSLADRQIYFSNNEIPFYLYWSPDSTNLAFLANRARNTIGLSVVAGDGRDDSRLLATGSPFYWDWSSDGQQLLIHSGESRSDSVFTLIDLDGGAQGENFASPGDFQAPSIGPQGRYWAYAEKINGRSTLAVVDTHSGERRAYEHVGSLAMSWSPTRHWLAFTNGSDPLSPFWGPLRLLDIDSQTIRLLSSQTVIAFFWSPDGRYLAFISPGRERNDDSVYAGAPVKLGRFSRLGSSPTQQPRRGFLTLSVVDVETGQGLRLLDFQPTATYFTQFLPFFDQYALSHRIWSPDSSSLVLPVREDDQNWIMIVKARGGRPARLATGEIAFWSHH